MTLALLLALALPGQWEDCPSPTTVRLRGVSVASPQIAWAVGENGTVLRTDDAGQSWQIPVKGSAGADFRDVEALGPNAACVLAVGPGPRSRIFRTPDRGRSWTVPYANTDPDGFLDALAFFDATTGLALGDPVKGRFVILSTHDGGATWLPIATNPRTMPPALEGESAFAASGTCLTVHGSNFAWFVTSKGRVFYSETQGSGWDVFEAPVPAPNDSSGLFSIAFRNPFDGVVAGGDHQTPATFAGPSIAVTSDGGRTWRKPTGSTVPTGLRSGLAWIYPGPRFPEHPGVVIAVGPAGADRSFDAGDSWQPLPHAAGEPGFHAVGFDSTGRLGFAVGENGRIARYVPKF